MVCADDLNSGADTVTDGIEIYNKIKSIFKEGNFNVRKWKTKNSELQKYLTKQENVTHKEQTHEEKVLGIIWNEADELVINTESYVDGAENLVATKRNILKILARIFDVAGIMQPVTVKLKLLFQKICASDLGWDEKINEELTLKFLNVVQEFRKSKLHVVTV